MIKLAIRVTLSVLHPRAWRALFFAVAYYLAEVLYPRTVLQTEGHVFIHPTARFRHPENISLGAGSRVNAGCMLWAGKTAKIIIAGNNLMGPSVKMFASNHGIAKGQLMAEQPWREADIVIEEDTWIGANAVITAGVRVGRGAVVAAGAVVTRDVPEGAIVAGVPARVVGERR